MVFSISWGFSLPMDGELRGYASSTREDSCHLAVYLLKMLYRYSHEGIIPVSQLWYVVQKELEKELQKELSREA